MSRGTGSHPPGDRSNQAAPGAREPACDLSRAISILSASGAVLALLALAILGVRAAVRLEDRWDTFWYHLPFAALRGGLRIPYEMNEVMQARYEGFPPLPELLQGILWRLTGSVNATGVINYLALAAFLAYCHTVLKARFWLVALIALTAPVVVIHTTVSYVDLFANSLLAIGLSSCLYLYLFPEQSSRTITVGGLGGFIGAAWSKFNLVPVVALGFGLFLMVCLRRPCGNAFQRRRIPLIIAGAALLAALPYLKNFTIYGNPFWPVRSPVLGEWFPYSEDLRKNVAIEKPLALQDRSQPVLFLHSLFEIDHPTRYPHRPRWTIDQGNAAIAFRMGGFWRVGVATYLLATLVLLVVGRGRSGIIASLAIVGTLGVVAVIPMSHTLRYYMFIPLCWAAAIGMLFPHFKNQAPRSAVALLLVILGLFSYMVSENWMHYRIVKADYLAAARNWGATPWWSQLERGKTYCAVDLMPLGMMLTGPTMTEYAIVDRSSASLCPCGSSILTRNSLTSGLNGPEEYLALSCRLYSEKSYRQAIAAAEQALQLRPGLAAAYNNICAAHNQLGQYPQAIAAGEQALRYEPGFELASNNLNYARQKIGIPQGSPTAH